MAKLSEKAAAKLAAAKEKKAADRKFNVALDVVIKPFNKIANRTKRLAAVKAKLKEMEPSEAKAALQAAHNRLNRIVRAAEKAKTAK